MKHTREFAPFFPISSLSLSLSLSFQSFNTSSTRKRMRIVAKVTTKFVISNSREFYFFFLFVSRCCTVAFFSLFLASYSWVLFAFHMSMFRYVENFQSRYVVRADIGRVREVGLTVYTCARRFRRLWAWISMARYLESNYSWNLRKWRTVSGFWSSYKILKDRIVLWPLLRLIWGDSFFAM